MDVGFDNFSDDIHLVRAPQFQDSIGSGFLAWEGMDLEHSATHGSANDGGLHVNLRLRDASHGVLHLGFGQLHIHVPDLSQTAQPAPRRIEQLGSCFHVKAALIAFGHGSGFFFVKSLISAGADPRRRQGSFEARDLSLLSGNIPFPGSGFGNRQPALRHRHLGIKITNQAVELTVTVQDRQDLTGLHQVPFVDPEFANDGRLP